jgi:hypothetical protein
VARLKTFRTRITEWAEPSPTVTEELVLVSIKEKRERTIDERKIEWFDEFHYPHEHWDVSRFEDLIEHREAVGTVSVLDAVLAYMLTFEWGRKSVITGFLRTYPQWKDVSTDTVGEALSRLAAEGFIIKVS